MTAILVKPCCPSVSTERRARRKAGVGSSKVDDLNALLTALIAPSFSEMKRRPVVTSWMTWVGVESPEIDTNESAEATVKRTKK